jgi:hypothetical protein
MQHVGLIAIIIYWVTVSSILYTYGYDSTKTISDHVATGRQKHIYTPLAIAYFLLITWFLYEWFLPNMNASDYHYILLMIGLVFLLLTFLIPRHGKNIYKHDLFATIVGSSMFVMLSTLIAREVDGVLALVSSIGLLGMLIAGGSLTKRNRRGYLQGQIFYFAILNVLILLLTYTR